MLAIGLIQDHLANNKKTNLTVHIDLRQKMIFGLSQGLSIGLLLFYNFLVRRELTMLLLMV